MLHYASSKKNQLNAIKSSCKVVNSKITFIEQLNCVEIYVSNWTFAKFRKHSEYIHRILVQYLNLSILIFWFDNKVEHIIGVDGKQTNINNY